MFSVNFSAVKGYAKAMAQAPKILLKHLVYAFRDIGRTDIQRFQEGLPGQLDIKAPGLIKSFKAKSTDPSRATDITKLFTDESTRWKAADIFEKGGTISGRGKTLTVLFDDAKTATGRRRWTQSQIRQKVASKEFRFVPTPRGILIVQDKGGLTKTGAHRKGSRSIAIGMLKATVNERKRIDFYANAEQAQGLHMDRLETAVEDAQVEIMSKEFE